MPEIVRPSEIIKPRFIVAAGAAAAPYSPSDNPASLIGWFRMGVGVTASGGFVSQWDDQSGNAHHQTQATGSAQPSYDGSAIITCDGIAQYMGASSVGPQSQPFTYALLVAQSWASGSRRILSAELNRGLLFQNVSTPYIALYSGSNAATNDNLPDDITAFRAVTALFNGASSSLLVQNTPETTGNPGAGNLPDKLFIGSSGTGGYGNIAVKEIIIRNVDDATIRANDHAYLQTL